MICDNITVKDGVLHFAGQNTVELAKKYGAPLYLMDEDKVRVAHLGVCNALPSNRGQAICRACSC